MRVQASENLRQESTSNYCRFPNSMTVCKHWQKQQHINMNLAIHMKTALDNWLTIIYAVFNHQHVPIFWDVHVMTHRPEWVPTRVMTEAADRQGRALHWLVD